MKSRQGDLPWQNQQKKQAGLMFRFKWEIKIQSTVNYKFFMCEEISNVKNV